MIHSNFNEKIINLLINRSSQENMSNVLPPLEYQELLNTNLSCISDDEKKALNYKDFFLFSLNKRGNNSKDSKIIITSKNLKVYKTITTLTSNDNTPEYIYKRDTIIDNNGIISMVAADNTIENYPNLYFYQFEDIFQKIDNNENIEPTSIRYTAKVKIELTDYDKFGYKIRAIKLVKEPSSNVYFIFTIYDYKQTLNSTTQIFKKIRVDSIDLSTSTQIVFTNKELSINNNDFYNILTGFKDWDVVVKKIDDAIKVDFLITGKSGVTETFWDSNRFGGLVTENNFQAKVDEYRRYEAEQSRGEIKDLAYKWKEPFGGVFTSTWRLTDLKKVTHNTRSWHTNNPYAQHWEVKTHYFNVPNPNINTNPPTPKPLYTVQFSWSTQYPLRPGTEQYLELLGTYLRRSQIVSTGGIILCSFISSGTGDSTSFTARRIYIQTNINDVGDITHNDNYFFTSFKLNSESNFRFYRCRIDNNLNPNIQELANTDTSPYPFLIKEVRDWNTTTNYGSSILAINPLNSSRSSSLIMYKRNGETTFNNSSLNQFSTNGYTPNFLAGIREQNLLTLFVFNNTFTKAHRLTASYTNKTPNTEPYLFNPYNNDRNNFLGARIVGKSNGIKQFDGNIADIPAYNNTLIYNSTVDKHSMNDITVNEWIVYSNTNNELFSFNTSKLKTRPQSLKINFDVTISVLDNIDKKAKTNSEAANTFTKLLTKEENDLALLRNQIGNFKVIYTDGTYRIGDATGFLRAGYESDHTAGYEFNYFGYFEISLRQTKQIKQILLYNKNNEELCYKDLNYPSAANINLSIRFQLRSE